MGLQLVSCSPRLRIDIRAAQANYTPKGDPLPESRELFVQFYPGGNVSQEARDEVAKLPGFWSGIARDEDPFTTRIGWWDSVAAQQDYGWSDEEREYVEERLLKIADPNVMVLRETQVAAPYANWEKHRKLHGKRTIEHVLADIQTVYETAGFDVNQAVAHERQNGNDPRIVEFLEGLGTGETVQESAEEVVAA